MAARLTVVGSGIQVGRDLSPTALHYIMTAEKVLELVGDPATMLWLRELNPTVESLARFYSPKKPRLQTYQEMTDRILSFVSKGVDVCVVTYGHPGVAVYASHKAIERARGLGVEATMLPAVSCVDCLIADLGIDPAMDGLAIYDATDFLIRRRRFDANSPLVLTQIAVTCVTGYKANGAYPRTGLRALAAKLARTYGRKHKSVIYEASTVPVAEPIVRQIALGRLGSARVTSASTLYVPPRGSASVDKRMLALVDGE
jgi:hypothetical protein